MTIASVTAVRNSVNVVVVVVVVGSVGGRYGRDYHLNGVSNDGSAYAVVVGIVR